MITGRCKRDMLVPVQLGMEDDIMNLIGCSEGIAGQIINGSHKDGRDSADMQNALQKSFFSNRLNTNFEARVLRLKYDSGERCRTRLKHVSDWLLLEGGF